MLEDLGAVLPSPAGQRRGQVGRVRLAVAGQPDRADEVVGLHHREALERLLRREQLALQVECRRRCRRTPKEGHPVLRARDGDATAPLEAGGQADLGLQLGVELGGVLHEPGAALVRTQLPHQTGGVPGGARRQLALLQDHDVGLTQLGQVVGDARPDDAAADDDDPCSRRDLLGHQSSRLACSSRDSNSGPSNSSTARSYFSIPHDQKSKSIELTECWIEPHSVQPYLDISPQSRARATRWCSSRPSYASISSSSWSTVSPASLQMLPSSKQASLLPAYS